MFSRLQKIMQNSSKRCISYLSNSSGTILSQLHAWNLNQQTYLDLLEDNKNKKMIHEKNELEKEKINQDEIEYLTKMALKHAISN